WNCVRCSRCGGPGIHHSRQRSELSLRVSGRLAWAPAARWPGSCRGSRQQRWGPRLPRADRAERNFSWRFLLNRRSARVCARSLTELQRSVSQRVGTHLHLEHFRISLRPALTVEVRAGAGSGPDAATFPAGRGVVDPAVDILGEEAERVRHPHCDEFAVDQGEQRLAAVGAGDWHIGAEAEDVVAVDPDVIGMVGAALGIQALELRTGQSIELPAFWALLAFRRGRPIEPSFAQLAIEARQMTAREHRPDQTVQSEINAARTKGTFRRLIHFR